MAGWTEEVLQCYSNGSLCFGKSSRWWLRSICVRTMLRNVIASIASLMVILWGARTRYVRMHACMHECPRGGEIHHSCWYEAIRHVDSGPGGAKVWLPGSAGASDSRRLQ